MLISIPAISVLIDKKRIFYIRALFGVILFSKEELGMMSNAMSSNNLV